MTANDEWNRAQAAEAKSWAALWESDDSENRHDLMSREIKKQSFILSELEDALGLSIEGALAGKDVIDVGCGPVSFVARLDSPQD